MRLTLITPMIRDNFIRYNKSSLHYAKAGTGDRHLLIFHGFGQDMNVFEFFATSLARHYTFYVFDLYFHGKAAGHTEKSPFQKKNGKKPSKYFCGKIK